MAGRHFCNHAECPEWFTPSAPTPSANQGARACRLCGHPEHGDKIGECGAPCGDPTGEGCGCETMKRDPGCQCDLEPGDSECPVHPCDESHAFPYFDGDRSVHYFATSPRCSKPGHSGVTCSECAGQVLQDTEDRLRKARDTATESGRLTAEELKGARRSLFIVRTALLMPGGHTAEEMAAEVARLRGVERQALPPHDPAETRALVDLIDQELARIGTLVRHGGAAAARVEMLKKWRGRLQTLPQAGPAAAQDARQAPETALPAPGTAATPSSGPSTAANPAFSGGPDHAHGQG